VSKSKLFLPLLFLAFTSLATAQVPKGNIFFGYSYAHADLTAGHSSNLNGWEGSLEGKVFPLLGIVADFSGHYGGVDVPLFCPGPCGSVHLSGNEKNVLFGPRLSVSVGKLRPFAEVLVGVGHVSASGSGASNSDTSLATAVGGGVDYHLVPLIALRIQADYFQTRFFSTRQDNARIATGIVFNF
jgi:opacity protein-like surface antigen